MKKLREIVAALFSHTPKFKGKGRLVLVMDRLLEKYCSADGYLVIGTVNGLALMNFDLRPWGQKFAYYYGEWESDYIQLARSLYKGGAFVDVGSSIGLYVVCLGDLVRDANARIISIEPVPINMVKQRENVALNALSPVVDYFPVALGAEKSVLLLSVDPYGRDNNAYASSEGSVEVSVVTLDSLVADNAIGRVGFIKIDVEGFEPMVVAGSQGVIKRDHPIVFAEFNRERMHINGFVVNESWRFFLAEGYRAYQVVAGKLTPIVEPGDKENIFFLPSHMAISKACLL